MNTTSTLNSIIGRAKYYDAFYDIRLTGKKVKKASKFCFNGNGDMEWQEGWSRKQIGLYNEKGDQIATMTPDFRVFENGRFTGSATVSLEVKAILAKALNQKEEVK